MLSRLPKREGFGGLRRIYLDRFCESQVCSVNPTYDIVARDLPYKATNRWYNPQLESLDDFKIDLDLAKNTYLFTHLRVLMAQWGNLTPTQFADTATAIIQVFGSNIQPVIFNQDQFKLFTEAEAKAAVDFALSLFPNVAYWELINEPHNGSDLYNTAAEIDAYYTKIRNVATYLKSKITVPMSIGFHHHRQEAFDRLNDLCDIYAFHWYPCIAQMFGTAYKEKDLLYRLPRIAPLWLRVCRNQDTWPIQQTDNWVSDFIRMLDWLKTQANGKPYIINEFGFAIDPFGSQTNPSKLEKCQACYIKQILEAMRHYQDPNFQGYYVYAFRTSGFIQKSIWCQVVRYDRSPLPAAAFFP